MLLWSSYFMVANTILTWPKFYGAALCLLGLRQLIEYRRLVLGSVFLGASILAHDSLAFFAMCFYGLEILKLIVKYTKKPILPELKYLIASGMLAGLTMLPWLLVKRVLYPAQPRLIYMHFFCQGVNTDMTIGMKETMRSYLQDNSAMELLLPRLSNMLHPFDIGFAARHLDWVWKNSWAYYTVMLNGETFGKPILGFGVVGFLLALVGFYLLIKKSDKLISPIFASSLLTVIPSALFTGCYWANSAHTWAFMLYLSFAAAAGFVLVKIKFSGLILGVLVSVNLFSWLMIILFLSPVQPYLHASPIYLLFTGLLTSVIVLVGIFHYQDSLTKRNDSPRLPLSGYRN